MIWQAVSLHANFDCARIVSARDTQLTIPRTATIRLRAGAYFIIITARDRCSGHGSQSNRRATGVVKIACVAIATSKRVIPVLVGGCRSLDGAKERHDCV